PHRSVAPPRPGPLSELPGVLRAVADVIPIRQRADETIRHERGKQLGTGLRLILLKCSRDLRRGRGLRCQIGKSQPPSQAIGTALLRIVRILSGPPPAGGHYPGSRRHISGHGGSFHFRGVTKLYGNHAPTSTALIGPTGPTARPATAPTAC